MAILVDVDNAGDMAGQIPDLQYNSDGIITNSTLRHEEWLMYEDRLIKIARDELIGIADLRMNGLTFDLGSIGTLVSLYETVGDMKGPQVDMDAMTPGQYDRPEFGVKGIPIPVFHSHWHINARQLEASRKRGEPLSTTMMETQARLMMESLETALFNGIPNLVVDGKKVEGYTSFPDRNIVGGLKKLTWGLADGNDAGDAHDNPDGAQIVRDVKDMVEAANEANRRGPFTMYVSQDIWLNLNLDYSAAKGTQTIYSRILAFPGISAIKPSTYMEPSNILLVQMTSDVVDLAIARDVTNQEIITGNNLQTEFMMYTILAPRIKSDFNGSCGIVHAVLT